MLVSDVIDQTNSMGLHPAGISLGIPDILNGAINDSVTSLTLTTHADVPQGIIEIDSEIIYVYEAETTTTLSPVERGFWDTVAATHANGARVWIGPEFPRKTILNALNAIIGDLPSHGLYLKATDTDETWTDLTYKELPTGGVDVVDIVYLDELSRPTYLERNTDYEVITSYEPARYRIFSGGDFGRTLSVIYKKDFAQVTTESDNLTTIGIPVSLQNHLWMGIAGYLLQSRDIQRAEESGFQTAQIGAAINVGQAMLRNFERYVENEVRKLLLRRPTQIVFGSR